MGGRGRKSKKYYPDSEVWAWLGEVDNNRLENYIKRSAHLGNNTDPQGRSIHDVAYHAERELNKRKNSK